MHEVGRRRAGWAFGLRKTFRLLSGDENSHVSTHFLVSFSFRLLFKELYRIRINKPESARGENENNPERGRRVKGMLAIGPPR